MTLSFPRPLTDRFALIISALHAAVAARIRHPPVTAGIIVFICARLRRVLVAFERLAGQIRAGTYVARRRGTRGATGAGPRRGASVVMLHWTLGLPPWHPAWLHRVAPGDAGVWAGALREVLSDPDMAAVLAAVPRMRRILRPLCFMLGVERRLLTPPVPAPAAADGAEIFGMATAPAGAAGAAPHPNGARPIAMRRIPDMAGDVPEAIFSPA